MGDLAGWCLGVTSDEAPRSDRRWRWTEPHMKRLTKKDWQIINTALAAYEAEDWQAVHGWSDEEALADARAVSAVRKKVWERCD